MDRVCDRGGAEREATAQHTRIMSGDPHNGQRSVLYLAPVPARSLFGVGCDGGTHGVQTHDSGLVPPLAPLRWHPHSLAFV